MPSPSTVHIDTPLTNVAIRGFNTGVGEVADLIFPVVPVAKQTDKYYTFTKATFLRIPSTIRDRKSASGRIDWQISSDSYYCRGFGLAAEYPTEDIANADQIVALRETHATNVAETLARDRARRVARLVSSGGNLGSGATLSGTTLWSDYMNSDPIANVTTGHAYIRNNTGFDGANIAITTRDVLDIVRRHPDLLDMYKYTAGGMLNDAQLATVFGVERIIIGTGIVENALEGGTSSITNIWPNNFILARINPVQGAQTATLGLQFRWTNPELGQPFAIQRDRFDQAGTNHTEVVEARYWQDEKIVAAELGYVIQTAI